MTKQVSKQYIYQQELKKKGKCRTCGKKRNKSKEFCDKHLKYESDKRNRQYHTNKEFRERALKIQQKYRQKVISLTKKES